LLRDAYYTHRYNLYVKHSVSDIRVVVYSNQCPLCSI